MLVSFVIALVSSLALCPLVIGLSRRLHVFDHPTDRSSHAIPTPRLGGIAVSIALLLALALSDALPAKQANALIIVVVLFGLLGLADDLWSLPALHRLALQGLFALGPLPWLLANVGNVGLWQITFGFGVWCWILAWVNAFNFMDGINGIAAIQAILAGGAWWLIGDARGVPSLAIGGAILSGAALGFLPHNFPHARTFLGDVGSYALGAWIAVLVVIALRADISPVAALAPVSLALADTSMTIARRSRRGQPLLQPHREHAYQRLVAMGWSHATTAMVIGAILFCCAVIGVATAGASVGVQIAAGFGVLAIDGVYLGLPAAFEWPREGRG